MAEIWKPIPGYESSYEVSTEGRVRSLTRFVDCEGPVKGSYRSLRQGKLLRPGRMPGGHVSVALGKGNSQCVHTLVLLAFEGAPAEGLECRHLNGDPADNRLKNLCWGTRSENIKDKSRHGLSRLKPSDVRKIKKALESPYRGLQKQLADEYGISECLICDIKKGRCYV